MTPTPIPTGSVFVKRRRGVNVAAQLLEAAEQIDADRITSVRSTLNGYHVEEAVAERYQQNLRDAGELDEESTEDGGDAGTGDDGSQDDGSTGDDGQTGDNGSQDNGNDDGNTGDTGSTGDDGSQGDESKSDVPDELPVTEDNKRDEIDAYGANLNPPVDTTKASTKAEAIKLLEEDRAKRAAEANTTPEDAGE